MAGIAEDQWDTLIERIGDQNCTPILGHGACAESPPVGCDPAAWKFSYPLNSAQIRAWAEKTGYPFRDSNELARVAQFVAVERDQQAPKDYVRKLFAAGAPPDFTVENEPHRILAALPFPVYLTTNFDGYLARAIQQRPERDKDPRVRICRWNDTLPEDLDPMLSESETPSVANPLVYHLFGRADQSETLVLTEDEQYEFLMNIARDEQERLNHRVHRVLGSNSILFLGYSLRDREFLLLFRLLDHFLRARSRIHVAVQLAADETTDPDKLLAYLDKYYGSFKVSVYLGDCKQFAAELWSRWKARQP